MTTIFEVLVLWVVPFSNIAVLGTQRVFSAFMYSGFSWVLYSRLHLVIQSSKILRIIFWTIVATGVSCNLPGILDICIPSLMRNPKLFEIFSGTDIVFSVQEIVLSSVYIYFFYQFARGGSLEPRDRATLTLLVIAQMVIILSDAATTVLIYIHFYILRMALLPFTYAVKLRLEFVVLNRLSARSNLTSHSMQASTWNAQHTARNHQQLSNGASTGWRSGLKTRPGNRGLLRCCQSLEPEASEWPTRVEDGEQWISRRDEAVPTLTTPGKTKSRLSGCA
ncbi:hypothetical protein Vi05172_g4917 [Venturia inaequalis]|nr:hypothetical protein Vi05172_g4917 [Venturia inaequalis]